jgi:hypothetical protein
MFLAIVALYFKHSRATRMQSGISASFNFAKSSKNSSAKSVGRLSTTTANAARANSCSNRRPTRKSAKSIAMNARSVSSVIAP